MRKIKVLYGQSLLDIAIQELGSVEGVFDLALANGLSITQDLTPGSSVIIPAILPIDREIFNYYAKNNIHPVTANLSEDLVSLIGEAELCGEYNCEYTEEYTACDCTGVMPLYSEDYGDEYYQD